MERIFSILLLLSLVVAGCRVGPDYHRPQIAVEPSFESLPEQAPEQPYKITTGPIQAAQWWGAFNDPTLDSLMEKAAEANNDLLLATARVREARARRLGVAGGHYPDVTSSASYSRERASKNAWPFNAFDAPGFPWEADLYQAGFDASWELDIFGGVRRRVEAAEADLQASVENRRSVLLSVLAEVARNYVELRGYQQQAAITRKNLEAQRQTLELTTEQASKGIGTQLDVSRAAALVSTTEAGLPRLDNLQWQTMHRLAVLTGQQPGTLVEALSSIGSIPVPPAEISTGVPADLLRRRPDIRQAERELAAASARVGIATADLYPRFSLTGSFSLQSSEVGTLPKSSSMAFGVGPAVRWPLFNDGALRAAVEVRDAQQEQALIRYEQTVLQALEEVHDALTAFVTEQDRHKSLQEAVKASAEAAELAMVLYQQGVTDFISVLDAERQLYRSQADLLQSETAVTTSVVALYKSLGGGWQTDEPLEQAEKEPSHE